jgi:hypothetical protein
VNATTIAVITGFAPCGLAFTPRDSRCRWGSASAQLREALGNDARKEELRLRTLLHERQNGCGERCPEGRRLEHADMGSVESSEGLRGKVVVTTALDRG